MEQNDHFEQVLRAIEYIEGHLRESIGIQDVCALSPLSSWQFQRVFRALVGDSVGNYIRGRRLAQAAQLLQAANPPNRILDLAIEFQFGSQEAFTRAFKTNFGVTPADVRSRPLSRLPMAKPKLDKNKLSRMKANISREPVLRNLGPKIFLGLPTQIASPLGIDTEYESKVPSHWEKFDKRRSEISDRILGCSYALIYSSSQNMEDETLTYLSAVEVQKKTQVPSDMQVFELAESNYAVFEIKGFLETCHITTDYIYGIWLPQSKFIRGQGPDIEHFEHKNYNRDNANSFSHYFLPIVSR